MKKILLLLTLTYFGSSLYAQNLRRCSTMESHAALLENHPEMEQEILKIEDFTQKCIEKDALPKQGQVVITIPVVVHVVHTISNPVSNISEAQIQSQIDVLNEDFRRLNADASLTPAEFLPVAADTEIEFCLAQRDPNNLPSTGIVRTPTVKTSFSTSANDVKSPATGGASGWNSSKYLNIWVCNNIDGGETLGYAQFPGGSATTDGVVIAYQFFGRVGAVVSPFNKGRTATHEVGHWLNLFHIWGDDFGSCSQDDAVSDTPRSADAWYGCPPVNSNSCVDSPVNFNDMFQNYMDYTDDACMNIYTLGQKQRMQALFMPGGARFSITSSEGCLPVEQGLNDAVLTSLVSPTGTGNCTTVSPVINVQNYGTADLFYFIVEYGFPTGPVHTYEWTGLIPTIQSAEITLPAITTITTGIIQTININITQPNGQTDYSPDDNSGVYSFAVISSGAQTPASEDFEAGTNFNSWSNNNPDGLMGFALNNSVGSSSSASVYMNNFIYNAPGANDEISTPYFDLSDISDPYLYFDVAYALKTAGDASDVLQVLISTDCGETFTNIYTKAGDNLVTAPPVSSSFVPNQGQWRTEYIELLPYQAFRNVIIRFKQIRGAGNNLYIDNFLIRDGVVGIEEMAVKNESQLLIYPNPASSEALLVFQAEHAGSAVISMTDLSGKTLLVQETNLITGFNQLSLNVQDFAEGIYLIHLVQENQLTATQKLAIMR
ncbi:MAG: T9SS type A sorting domain-containing protein [Sphingobacteriales bacterium]|nr:MAG: T9SS type A sorting domain-containing protein [Sphingobacteriales bacterium]